MTTAVRSWARCSDCGRKASTFVPVDAYVDPHAAQTVLCLGCLAQRRLRNQHWKRVTR